MNQLDYALVIIYLISMILLGRLFKKSKVSGDYFLGGRQFGWFALCMSAMATQLSVISFVSAPAFVGLRPGGGMKWLSFEFGVPIAMLLVMAIIAPALYRSGVVSIYSFLEKRFNTTTRLLISLAFMFSRSFATGVTVYTVCLILSSLMHLSFTATILIVGVTTVVYSLEGGMKAVVYSEVAQMIIKVLGIIIIVIFGLKNIGGWDVFQQNLDTSRLQVIDLSNTGFDGGEYGFWPMLLGGIFLYCSYYGTDQIQAQRIISAKDLPTVRKVLLFNGLLRFPITFLYCLGGLIVGTFVKLNADFAAKIPADKTDLMIPVFIENYLPHGVIGIIVVAVIAAAMSAYSSALNSLSAVTMEEFLSKRMTISDDKYVYYSKAIALVWGVVTMVLAFFVGDIAKTVIEAINKIGSIFYGPILGIFLLAILTKKVHARAANAGLVLGILLNIYLWKCQPQVFWFWWNVIGLLVTVSIGLLGSRFIPSGPTKVAERQTLEKSDFKLPEAKILLVYLLLILLVSWALPMILGR
jgi:SSS family transporter